MNMTKTIVVVMVVFAGLLVLGGLAAFVAAPPEANPKTALIIPGSCAGLMLLVAGLLHASIAKGRTKMAMISGHLGLVLPFLFALLFLPPALARTRANQNFPAAKAAFDAAVSGGQTFPTESDREQFFKLRKSPDHDQTYLVVTLWSLIGLSVATGVTLVMLGVRSRRDALRARQGT